MKPAMPAVRARPLLDRWPARAIAVAVFLLAAASLVWFHRQALFGGDDGLAANDPFTRCMATRTDDLERMLRDGMISADQAAIFRARLDGVCRAQTAAR